MPGNDMKKDEAKESASSHEKNIADQTKLRNTMAKLNELRATLRQEDQQTSDWFKTKATQLELLSKTMLGKLKTAQDQYNALQDKHKTLQDEHKALQDKFKTSDQTKPASRPGNLSVDEEEEKEAEKTAEKKEAKEEVLHSSKKIQPLELLQLTLDYKRRSYLAKHSRTLWPQAENILNTYEKLLKDIYQDTFQELIHHQPDLTAYFDKHFMPKENTLTEYNKLKNITTLNELCRFGHEYYLINNETTQINASLTEIDQGKTGRTDPEPAQTDLNQACIMKLILKDPNSNDSKVVKNVERIRDQDHKLIFESYLPLNLSEPLLKDWARDTMQRILAKARVRRINFNDGYTPDQLASLISYCHFIGCNFRVSDMQKVRVFAKALHQAGKITDEQLKDFNENQEVQLNNLQECLTYLNTTYPGLDISATWVQLTTSKAYPHRLSQCTEDEWQAWSIKHDHPQIPPLGHSRHNHLLTQYNQYKNEHNPAPTQSIKKTSPLVQLSLHAQSAAEEKQKVPLGGIPLPSIPKSGVKVKGS